MAAEDNLTPGSKDQPLPEATPAERLESALGGDLTRFLLSALANAQPALRDPR